MIPIQNTPMWREVESLVSSYVTEHPQEFDELGYPDRDWINELDYVVRDILRCPADALIFIEEKCGNEGLNLLQRIRFE